MYIYLWLDIILLPHLCASRFLPLTVTVLIRGQAAVTSEKSERKKCKVKCLPSHFFNSGILSVYTLHVKTFWWSFSSVSLHMNCVLQDSLISSAVFVIRLNNDYFLFWFQSHTYTYLQTVSFLVTNKSVAKRDLIYYDNLLFVTKSNKLVNCNSLIRYT